MDGYAGKGYFHFNWGWNGDFNGNYLLSALLTEDNMQLNQCGIFDCIPSTMQPVNEEPVLLRSVDIDLSGDIPVYTGSRQLLAEITGYTLTRGVLCAMRRREAPKVEDVCRGASRVVVVDNVVEATNIGSIFRSAAALGIDAVLLTSNSCDPLTRRAVRVSMGSVFLVPWTWLEEPVQWLNTLGFKTVAMALTDKSVSVSDPVLTSEPRLAIVMGTEGDGLPHDTIADADYVARIPMSHNVDSLNVAAASAVAFWELRRR